jgi:hypothetical protein
VVTAANFDYLQTRELQNHPELPGWPLFVVHPADSDLTIHAAALQLFVSRLFDSGHGVFPVGTTLRLVDVAGDGNCQIHALVAILRAGLPEVATSEGLTDMLVRLLVRDFYQARRSEYESLLGKGRAYDRFLRDMVTDGKPTGQAVQTALEQLLDINVFCLSCDTYMDEKVADVGIKAGKVKARKGKGKRKQPERVLLPRPRPLYTESHIYASEDRAGRPAVVILFIAHGNDNGHYMAVVPSALTLGPKAQQILLDLCSSDPAPSRHVQHSDPDLAVKGGEGEGEHSEEEEEETGRGRSDGSGKDEGEDDSDDSDAEEGRNDGNGNDDEEDDGDGGDDSGRPMPTADEVVTAATGVHVPRALTAASDTLVLTSLTTECGLTSESSVLCVGYPSTAFRAAMLAQPPRITMCVTLDSQHHEVRVEPVFAGGCFH